MQFYVSASGQRHLAGAVSLVVASETVHKALLIPPTELDQTGYKQGLRPHLKLLTQQLALQERVPLPRVELQLLDWSLPALPEVTCRRVSNPHAQARQLAWQYFKEAIDQQHQHFPHYSWLTNSGMPTEAHLLALLRYGHASGIHHAKGVERLACWLYRQVRQVNPKTAQYQCYLYSQPPWWNRFTKVGFTACLTPVQRASLQRGQQHQREFQQWCQQYAP